MVLGKNKRTHVYYAHPYSSWERGSNENANRLLRRFIPKGSDILKFGKSSIMKVQGFATAEERYLIGGGGMNGYLPIQLQHLTLQATEFFTDKKVEE